MVFFRDPRTFDPNKNLPTANIARADSRTMRSLARFSTDLSKTIKFLFIQDLGKLNLLGIMHSANIGIRAGHKLEGWEISVGARALGYRLNFFQLAAEPKNKISFKETIPGPVPRCDACFGIGSMRKVLSSGESKLSIKKSLGAIDSKKVKRHLPGAIIIAHQKIANSFDRMRGEGDMDEVLRAIEEKMISLRRSVWHYEVFLEARTFKEKKTIICTLGALRLAPLRINNFPVPVGSRWEAGQLTGRKFPIEITYFEACPLCLGLGVKLQ